MEIRYIQGDVSVWRKPHGYTFCVRGWALPAIFALLSAMPLAVASAASSQLRVVVSDTRGARLSDAVVTLRPTSLAAKAGARDASTGNRSRSSVPAEPVVIQQLDREFVPRVTVVPVGARVSLPNNDASMRARQNAVCRDDSAIAQQ